MSSQLAADAATQDSVDAVSGAVDLTNADLATVAAELTTHEALATAHGISSFGHTLVAGADAATDRTTLGLVIGTNVQAHSAVLDATTASYTTTKDGKIFAATSVTGAKGGNAALASLITALATAGIITDNTT